MKNDFLIQKDKYKWEIPQDYQSGMNVPGIIFSDEKLIEQIIKDNAFKQVANVANLPGIFRNSLAMPDIHWGYGFPIGGVAAIDTRNGVVSPGGVGSDINCGVRMLNSNMKFEDIQDKIGKLLESIFTNVPSGIGKSGKISLSHNELEQVLVKGSRWAVENGYGKKIDLLNTEDQGEMRGAKPDSLSQRARKRGLNQLGTLGSGNHFIEIQVVDEIFDSEASSKLHIHKGDVMIMIHTGSRGLGYQVCDDYAKGLIGRMENYGISVPDKQLACAPIDSKDGKTYLQAMAGAANYAWANRQVIMHWVRKAVSDIMRETSDNLGLELIYDVAHNIAKFETHHIDGKEYEFLVHRKGATRAFAPGRQELPGHYRNLGQPVIIPGDMGTASYILLGTEGAMKETFGSTCHGAGRVMSRRKAKRTKKGSHVISDLKKKGIKIRAAGIKTVAEEMPEAYKNIDEIIDIVHNAGISKKVARMKPLGVVKG
ncbi:MAG: RtcB family protein [Candidatus Zixiibacteriota bacterium]